MTLDIGAVEDCGLKSSNWHQKISVRASQRSGEGGLVVSIEIVLIPMMMFGLFLAALIIVFGQCAGNPA
ncbi:hypothetical protein ACC704_30470 [Rhizobium johnstonii]|uniref:hypothetical protein n=1 Tax=Rhizobium johnstonii TaxID=3019933 RepID=UPI003F9532A0